jgi:ABC-type uncharacterized transport system permease subunit
MNKKLNLKVGRSILVSLISIILGFAAGAVLMLTSGANPFEGFSYLFKGGLMGFTRVCNTIAYSATLILTGLSITFAFKTGLFNIGAPGQMLFGALCSTITALTVSLPRPLMLPLVVIVSMLGGMVWAAVAGILKAKFNVNEVVSGIMLNWTAYWIVYIVISEHYKSSIIETESCTIPPAASLKIEALTQATGGSQINMGILIAIAATLLIAFILNKTVMGYEMKAVGFNRYAAEYAGINVNRSLVMAMIISGGLAGLAGVTYYGGYVSNMQIGVMPSQGFDGIAVALLANISPAGVIFSALFFGMLHTGKGFMNAMLPIPPEIADTIVATVIYFSATSKLIELNLDNLRKFLSRKKKRRKGGEVDVADN